MIQKLETFLSALTGDPEADMAVPPSGFTQRLTTFTAAAMAFLAVFTLAFVLATDRLADQWGNELARSATLRIAGDPEDLPALSAAAMKVLETTPGIASTRLLGEEEMHLLLEPWLGPGLPLGTLPLPRLIDIVQESEGFDAAGLRARLEAEVPGAVLDDHLRWRAPLQASASKLRLLGAVSLLLIAGATGAMITLAAQSALSAHEQVIRVLRLVGAKDNYIAGAFIRRFTSRALLGALIGTLVGTIFISVMPAGGEDGGFLTGIGFAGLDWLWACLVPIFATLVGFLSTRAATLRNLRTQS